MANLGFQDLQILARDAGFPVGAATVAAAIALAESGGNPTAVNRSNSNGTVDYGLWQINSVHANLLAGKDWKNPKQNAAMAYTVYKNAGNRFTPWSTFNSGSYKGHLNGRDTAGGIGTNPDGSFNDAGANTNAGNRKPTAEDLKNMTPEQRKAFEWLDEWDQSGPFDALKPDWLKNLGHITANLLDPNFWLRAGIGILGVFIIIVGLVFIMSNTKAGKAVANAVPAAKIVKG